MSSTSYARSAHESIAPFQDLIYPRRVGERPEKRPRSPTPEKRPRSVDPSGDVFLEEAMFCEPGDDKPAGGDEHLEEMARDNETFGMTHVIHSDYTYVNADQLSLDDYERVVFSQNEDVIHQYKVPSLRSMVVRVLAFIEIHHSYSLTNDCSLTQWIDDGVKIFIEKFVDQAGEKARETTGERKILERIEDACVEFLDRGTLQKITTDVKKRMRSFVESKVDMARSAARESLGDNLEIQTNTLFADHIALQSNAQLLRQFVYTCRMISKLGTCTECAVGAPHVMVSEAGLMDRISTPSIRCTRGTILTPASARTIWSECTKTSGRTAACGSWFMCQRCWHNHCLRVIKRRYERICMMGKARKVTIAFAKEMYDVDTHTIEMRMVTIGDEVCDIQLPTACLSEELRESFKHWGRSEPSGYFQGNTLRARENVKRAIKIDIREEQPSEGKKRRIDDDEEKEEEEETKPSEKRQRSQVYEGERPFF